MLINEVIDLLKDSARQKSITINQKIPQNLPVLADWDMVHAILRNLISNGIKFSHPGSEIVIGAQQEDGHMLVSVSDNGVGISEEDIYKLFRLDYSYSTMGTEDEKVTGLGLLLCKEFVEKHGGRIWAESTEGEGSTFYFTIPQ